MGLFDSDYVYVAYAASSSLFDEDKRPDTLKSVLLQTTINDENTISEGITLALQTNMYARARSMIRYAERAYVRGLPESTHQLTVAPYDAVQDAIEAEIGEPVSSIYYLYTGNFDEDFFIKRGLKMYYNDPDYFPWDDPPDVPYWDESQETIQIPVINPDTGEYYVTDNLPGWERLAILGSALYAVHFLYTDNLGVIQRWPIPNSFNLTEYANFGDEWIQARYRKSSTPDQTDYWIYKVGSGEIPELEEEISYNDITGQYLPVVILMHDKVWFDEADPAEDDELELTTDRILKRLTLDAHEVKQDYLDQKAEDEESGEVNVGDAEEWDVFIHFAVPIYSDVRASIEYLSEYFKILEDFQLFDFDQYQEYLASDRDAQPINEIKITEGDIDGYNMDFRWTYAYSITRPGQYIVAETGEPLAVGKAYSKLYPEINPDGLYEVHGDGILIASDVGGDTPAGKPGFHAYAVFTQQDQDGYGNLNYTQVLVMAPSMRYIINTSEDDGNYRLRYVEAPLFGSELASAEFRLPIHIGALRAMPTMHREELLSDALCATVFLVEEIEVEWYQQHFFRFLIVIIVVIVLILAYQYQWLPKIWALAGAATGVTAASYYLLYVVMTFALGFLISFAGSVIGGRFGKYFVIVASLFISGKNPFKNLTASWTNIGTNGLSWGSAVSFINSAGLFLNFGFTVYQDIALAKLQSDMRDFIKTAREKEQELQDVWDTIAPPPSWLDPMDLIRIQSDNNYIEQAEEFYERVLNPNPGLLGYDLINSFPEIALTLPENLGEPNVLEIMFYELEQQRGAA
jgi:hypothetical protein